MFCCSAPYFLTPLGRSWAQSQPPRPNAPRTTRTTAAEMVRAKRSAAEPAGSANAYAKLQKTSAAVGESAHTWVMTRITEELEHQPAKANRVLVWIMSGGADEKQIEARRPWPLCLSTVFGFGPWNPSGPGRRLGWRPGLGLGCRRGMGPGWGAGRGAVIATVGPRDLGAGWRVAPGNAPWSA